jgi:hypothetical protein
MRWTSWSLALVAATALASAVAVQAQSPAKNNTKEMTYTGCVEGTTGHYMLSHAMAEPAKGKEATATSGSAERTMPVTSTAIDLSKHAGHKVTVTGAAGTGTAPFMISSLKMVSTKC